jgi:hypothetical protein
VKQFAVDQRTAALKSNEMVAAPSKTMRMKIIKCMIILLLIAAAVAAGIVVLHVNKSDAGKIEAKTKDAASSAKSAVTDAVKAGTQMAGEVATNVAGDVKEGMQKAGEMATNVAAKAKVVATNIAGKVEGVTTNVVDGARQEFDSLSH